MTNPDYTAIALIVDRSGSMLGIAADAEGGINTFLEEQRKLDDRCDILLVDFDTVYQVVQDYVPAKKTAYYKLVPRGATALYDAMGHTIADLGARLAAMPEHDRPGKVMVVTMTDGQENSSKDWTHSMLADTIKRQQDEFNWEFIYLSSDPASVSLAWGLGVPKANTVILDDASGASYMAGTQSVRQTVNHYRGTGTVKVEDNDMRKSAKKEKK